VPATAAKRYRGRPGIRMIELTDSWATRQLLICMRDMNAMPRPEKALVRHLADGSGQSSGSSRVR
jgi:hypothetical protein